VSLHRRRRSRTTPLTSPSGAIPKAPSLPPLAWGFNGPDSLFHG
jgi:hypothetical protein